MKLQPTNETQNPFNDLLEIYTGVTTFSHLEPKVLQNCYYSLSVSLSLTHTPHKISFRCSVSVDFSVSV